MDAAEAGEVERLRRVLDEEAQHHSRLRADFANLQRRVAHERDAARRDGGRAALLPVLSVLDTLERALAAGSSDSDFYEGVAATHRLFIRALREAGAEAVESVGRAFDPQLHEAVATVPSSGVERERSRARCGAAGGSATSCSAPRRSWWPRIRSPPNGGEVSRLGLSHARAQASPRPATGGRAQPCRGAVQGDQRGLRGPERRRQARPLRRARGRLQGRG